MLETLKVVPTVADAGERRRRDDTLRQRIGVMKKALVASGLVSVVDPSWNLGRGKAYGLGTNHPRYEEHVSLSNQFTTMNSRPVAADDPLA